MDQTRSTISVICVTSKRKMSKPKLNPQTTDVMQDLRRTAENELIQSQNEENSSLKIKRMYTKKRYHDLQPVVMRPSENSAHASSFRSSVASSSANGLESQRKPVDHSSSCGMVQKMNKFSSETECDLNDLKRKQTMVDIGQPSLKKYIEEVKQAVPVIVPVAQFTQRNQKGDITNEQKSHLCSKKETPVYAPGSQEERWQLQILARGRVTCPKCKSVGRKTVDGLKKHLETCKLNLFTCTHCGKQLKTSTGMKYHVMADHNNLPLLDTGNDQAVKEKLRKVLKRMGKLKCSKEGCTGSFTSIMGYVYHMKKCGKEESELEKLLMNCKHCGKAYRSRAGLEYHVKNEHAPMPQQSEEEEVKIQKDPVPERTQSGRVQRLSAKVAVFHLREIASEELLKEWPKKKVQSDLVPDDRKLKYSRPGLPAFSQDTLRKWKNEVKLHKKVLCPNKGCGCFYTSVSGLKAHLGLCTLGEFESGKYRCLICKKEFYSESGVKYHINSIHSQDWFVVRSKAKSSKFGKPHKTLPKEDSMKLSDVPAPDALLDIQTPVASTSSGTTSKEGREGMKEKESRQEKDCNMFSGSDSESSSGETCSSDSESEDPTTHSHDDWALSRPLTMPGSNQQPGSNP